MVGGFVIARLGSTRLPGKNMLSIMDMPMIELMVERIQRSWLIDKVVIATSTEVSDDPLEKLAQSLGIGCYRGSLENVMDRITRAAIAYNCDTIVSLLGDNPLVHSDLIDDVIKFYQEGGYEYAATVTKEYPVVKREMKLFSVGVRVQIYSISAAEQWKDYVEKVGEGEKHSSSFMFENPDKFRIGYYEAKDRWAFMNRPELTFAVNYRKNFELIRSIFERNYPHDGNFSLEKVFHQLDQDKYLYLLMGSE